MLQLGEVELVVPIRRCPRGGRLAITIAVVEVVLTERDLPYLEDPSRSVARERLVIV